MEREPILQGSRDSLDAVDLAQRDDLAHVLPRIGTPLLEPFVIGLSVRAQTQEAQHQPLFASIAALCEECLRMLGVLDVLMAIVAAGMSGDHQVVVANADPLWIRLERPAPPP